MFVHQALQFPCYSHDAIACYCIYSRSFHCPFEPAPPPLGRLKAMGTGTSPSLVTQTFGVWTVVYDPFSISRRRRFAEWTALAKDIVKRVVRLITPSSATNEETPDDKKTDAKEFKDLSITGRMRNLLRFIKEIYSLGPSIFMIYIVGEALSIANSTASLYASNKLLETTTGCLTSEECRVSGIVYALAFQIFLEYISNMYSSYV